MRGKLGLIAATLATIGVWGWWPSGGPVQAAPATSSYLGVERTIQTIRDAWARPGARPEPNAEGWNALFNALLEDLRSYARATEDDQRLVALNRAYQISGALESVAWPPAWKVRDELRAWLRPRFRLAWARQGLRETVRALPASSDPKVTANRTRWVDFVRSDLGNALQAYDGATTVVGKQQALDRIHESLRVLNQRNEHWSWGPSQELAAAVADLFDRPNLDVSADAATVAPIFDVNLVETGPVTRKGYTSMVTAGPKTGFGLLPSDAGIAFYNSQSMVSVTPIWDFQQQIASDPQGQRAAKLYCFSATTYDWSNLTVTTVLRPTGLELVPSSTHNINAAIGSAPQAGGGLGRAIASLIGMNQQKITDKVYEGAMPKFQQQIPAEAAEEAQERIAAETAERNADLRSKYLIGNDTAAVRDFLITQLTLRSRPEAVFVSGLFRWRDAPGQRGADAPQPPRLETTFDPGVTADVHLGSLLSSAARGLWLQDPVEQVDNLMIVTRAVPPGTAPRDAVTVTRNVDFPTYLKAVDQARAAHDPRVMALRVVRPRRAPEFSTDARGFLVALIHDLELEVPAPDEKSGGNMIGVQAKVLRMKMPLAEVAVSFQFDTAAAGPPHVRGKVEEFTPGADAQVIAINNDENQGKPLTRFTSALVLGFLGTKVRNQNIDVVLDQLKLPGFAIREVSPLDPSGWLRVNLTRTEAAPLRESQPVQEAKPGPIKGPETSSNGPSAPNGAGAVVGAR